jgi:hypothetical protein
MCPVNLQNWVERLVQANIVFVFVEILLIFLILQQTVEYSRDSSAARGGLECSLGVWAFVGSSRFRFP